MSEKISFTLNGVFMETNVDSDMRLIDLLRDELHLTGTKIGCRRGECGAIPTVPAVLSAVEDATGIRFRTCPLVPDRVLPELKKAGLVK